LQDHINGLLRHLALLAGGMDWDHPSIFDAYA
jgi:hypothetical protein